MIRRTCPWWIRWYHRRQRALDRHLLLPAIRRRVELTAVDKRIPEQSQRWDDFVRTSTLAAWRLHQCLATSTHWQCACARHEAKEEYYGDTIALRS